jgi:hypothetical protein
MTLSRRLTFTAMVPLLLLFAVLFWVGNQYASEKRGVEATHEHVEDSLLIGAAIHELQRERGLSAGYLGMDGRVYWSEMLVQRRATDLAWSNMQQPSEGARLPAVWLSQLPGLRAEIRETRQQVADRNISVDASTSHYTDIITTLIEAGTVELDHIANLALADLSASYLALAKAKNQAGLERAMGTVGFSKRGFDDMHTQAFQAHRAAQRDHLQVAMDNSPDYRRRIAALSDTPAYQRVQHLRERADVHIRTNSPLGPDGDAWWEASTAWVDTLHEEETRLATSMQSMAQYRFEQASQRLVIIVATGIIALLLTVGLTQFAVHTVRRQLHALHTALVDSIRGKPGVDVPSFAPADELSRLAEVAEWAQARNRIKEQARREREEKEKEKQEPSALRLVRKKSA